MVKGVSQQGDRSDFRGFGIEVDGRCRGRFESFDTIGRVTSRHSGTNPLVRLPKGGREACLRRALRQRRVLVSVARCES